MEDEQNHVDGAWRESMRTPHTAGEGRYVREERQNQREKMKKITFEETVV